MRILHLTGDREDMGGILSVIRNVQTASAERGWHHSVLVHQVYRETRLPRLDYRHTRHGCADLPNHFAILARAALMTFEVARLLAGEHFDVIHAHTRGSLFVVMALAAIQRRRVIFTNHSYARRVGLYGHSARLKNFYTVLLTPNMARHYGLTEDFPKVSIIPDCCADRFFSEPLVTRRDRAAGEPLNLAGVGNIMRWKNWHLLARALRRLTDDERSRIHFSLWGPRPSDPDSVAYDRELRQLVASLGLESRFLFCGVSNSVSECLRKADWMVLPSTNEPCSVALSEALALGVPVLASASGGNVDIVRPGRTGVLFKPDDEEDLAERLKDLLAARVRPVPPADIRESVRELSATRVTEKFDRLYQQVARG